MCTYLIKLLITVIDNLYGWVVNMDIAISKEILKCCGSDGNSDTNSMKGKGNSVIITTLDSDVKLKHLLGSSNQIYAEITGWLTLVGSTLSSSLSSSLNEKDLKKIDGILASKSYLVGNALTVADIAVYVCIFL